MGVTITAAILADCTAAPTDGTTRYFYDGWRAIEEIVEVDGIVEIVEHRHREPVFYICDDQAVRAELLSRMDNMAPPK